MDNGLEWIGPNQWRISSDILDTYLIGLICLMVLTCNLYGQIFHIFWHIPAYECRSASGVFLDGQGQIPVAIWLLPSSIQSSARVPGPTPWLDLPRDASLEPQIFCRWCFRLSNTSPAVSTSPVLPSFQLKGSLDLLAWCEVVAWWCFASKWWLHKITHAFYFSSL